MKKTLQLLLTAFFSMAFVNAQSVGDTFIEGDFIYKITNDTPGTLEAEISDIVLLATVPEALVILGTASDGTNSYNITGVGFGAFSGSTNPKRVNQSREKTDDSEFHVIESVSLPSSVKILDTHAFRDLPNLMTINLENVESVGTSCFASDISLIDVGTPTSLITINTWAFYQAAIKTFNFPNTVTSIGTTSFQDVTSLTDVQVNWTVPGNIPAIASSVFNNLTLSGINLLVPASTSADYQAAAIWQNFNIMEGTLSTNSIEKEFGFSVYPNPAEDIITLQNVDAASVLLVDVTGKVALSASISATKNTVDLSALTSGIYLMRVVAENNVLVKRIVKK